MTLQPMDYEPPFFRSCTEEEAHNPWTKNPLKMEVGNVNSKHFVLALKVKSVLDPCEDERDEMQDDEVILGGDSMQMDESSDSGSEVSQSQDDQYIVAPVGKQQPEEENGMVDEETQDPIEDENQLARVKEWIDSRHLETIELTDVLSNFPDISVVLTEEIMDTLVKEGVLSKTGKDTYTRYKKKPFDYEFTTVKEELDGQTLSKGDKAQQVDERTYMKALYHALPMEYVTVSKLHKQLDKEANQTTVRKLIDKMIRDGYIEAKGNRRLGKRVIHSILTERKLMEVKSVLDSDNMDAKINGSQSKSCHVARAAGSNLKDLSTCGVLHSVGSDLTRMKGTSDINQNDSIRKTRENGGTPISMAEPVASRESFIPGNENRRDNGHSNCCEEADGIICSRSTQEKRSRKTSTVKEPILQYSKRQRSQAV